MFILRLNLCVVYSLAYASIIDEYVYLSECRFDMCESILNRFLIRNVHVIGM